MQIQLLKELYTKEAILKTINLFSKDFTINIDADEYSYILNVNNLNSLDLDEVSFMTKLQEQQLREMLNLQYGELREVIYKKAFSLVE